MQYKLIYCQITTFRPVVINNGWVYPKVKSSVNFVMVDMEEQYQNILDKMERIANMLIVNGRVNLIKINIIPPLKFK